MPTLTWIGKQAVEKHHLEIPYRLLEYDESLSVGDKESGNLLVQGDNLHALKALLPYYAGKVKCIYIDPPYNTGNENWRYNDNVNAPEIKKWLNEVVGQEGDDLTRHDKWLSMMYPRLQLLKKLLHRNGFIFISINFMHEHAYLRLICDEIFGKNNFIGEITWESTTQPINSGSARFNLQQKVEPILFYAKNKKLLSGFRLNELDAGLKYPHDGKLGKCRFEIIEKSDAGGYARPTMKFKILDQYPRKGKRWQIGEDTARDLEDAQKIEIVDGIVKKAVYPEDELDKRKFEPFWSHLSASSVGTAQSGKDLLNTIIGKAVGFDTVKPPELISNLLSHFDNNILVLDSFAGSGTTAQSVLELNKLDDGNRKFILVELEKDIAEEITAVRLKRVINGYEVEKQNGIIEKVEGLGGGFRYCNLGEPLFDKFGNVSQGVKFKELARHVFFSENGVPLSEKAKLNTPLIGTYKGVAYYLLFNGILGDKTVNGGNVLTSRILESLPKHNGPKIIFGESNRLSAARLKKENIVFKQIPYEIKTS